MIKRIAITGPESTGKSTLAEALARHFNTIWVPEYAREYIDQLKRPYSYGDVEKIALTQIEQEEVAIQQANKYLFADTELLVIKIWMQHAFGRVPDWLGQKLLERKYDLYLLCDIDLPWKPDGQREHPYKREYFFRKYKDELSNYDFNYHVISGSYDERPKRAAKLLRSEFV